MFFWSCSFFIPNSLNLVLQLPSKCLNQLRLQILQLFKTINLVFHCCCINQEFCSSYFRAISGDFKTVLNGCGFFYFRWGLYKTKFLVILVDNCKSWHFLFLLWSRTIFELLSSDFKTILKGSSIWVFGLCFIPTRFESVLTLISSANLPSMLSISIFNDIELWTFWNGSCIPCIPVTFSFKNDSFCASSNMATFYHRLCYTP